MIAGPLGWIGERARWVLLIGCLVAVFLPALSALLRPLLPALIALVLGLSVARMELRAFMRGFASPRLVMLLVILTALLMPVTAGLLAVVLPLVGMPDSFTAAAILFALAPPISSAAGLCFILGFDARRALEVTLVATVLTPLIGPVMIAALLPGTDAPPAIDLMFSLSRMILGGLAIGIAIRLALGGAAIAARKTEFDGISAIGMVLFVIPLFDGVGPLVFARPGLALAVLAFAVLLNFGANIVVAAMSRPALGGATAGALGLMWGNRTVALYLAALPFDPVFALFVALYQFPMYATPLVFGRR
ncbi:hypothetical protein [Aliiroseovarius sp. YM-037]|uniref:hypothetical protein n=1 Tax=Aliiroseovarius sp. YM-037 TaxID=3341728 RepID=UPI003A807921